MLPIRPNFIVILTRKRVFFNIFAVKNVRSVSNYVGGLWEEILSSKESFLDIAVDL